MVYNKESKTIQWRKYSLFNRWCWGGLLIATCKGMRSEHSCIPYTKINSKWIKDLNVRLESIKLLKENRWNTL